MFKDSYVGILYSIFQNYLSGSLWQWLYDMFTDNSRPNGDENNWNNVYMSPNVHTLTRTSHYIHC